MVSLFCGHRSSNLINNTRLTFFNDIHFGKEKNRSLTVALF